MSISIIGSGLIARNLLHLKNNTSNALIIAMGVSNSQDTEKSSFDRELSLVRNINTNDKVVYFSTCSIYDPLLIDNQYVNNKLKIEEMLIDKFNDLLIIRLPQLLGYGGNPNNLVNYLYFSIKNNKNFTIWSETERNILDINIIKEMIPIMISDNKTGIYNLAANKTIKVLEIVYKIEKILNKKGNYSEIKKKSKYNIDLSKIISEYSYYENYFLNSYYDDIFFKYLK